MLKKILILGSIIILFIQFIPVELSNPKVVAEPKWDSVQTKEMFFKACADCHSNETKWPWYANIAPISWLVAYDVKEGREHFNVSMWGVQKKNKGDEAAEEYREGEMPLWFYTPLHPEAKFTEDEKKEFLSGLIATFGEEDEKGH